MRHQLKWSRIVSAQVSIHASVKDATDSILPKWLTYRVSIHASVKDATFEYGVYSNTKSFNPRICKRCDTGLSDKDALKFKFQSTHL